jgi:hypothetical protein
MTSGFGSTEVFVTASVDETATTFEYGKITTLATGTQNQESLGVADSGVINGNEITIRLSLDKINAAVGGNVLGTTSTNTQAEAQVLIGSSLSGGLLLNSDQAAGSNFEIAGTAAPTPTPTPEPTATPTPSTTPTPAATPEPNGRFDERYSGTLSVGQPHVELRFQLRRSVLDAQINQNQGNQTIIFDLLDEAGNQIATADQRTITLENLTPGTYIYRVRGTVSKAVDFTIKSRQGP